MNLLLKQVQKINHINNKETVFFSLKITKYSL